MDTQKQMQLLTELYKMADFVSKGGTLKLLLLEQRFGDVGARVLARLHSDRFHNVIGYTSLERSADNPHFAVGSLFKESVEKLAQILGVEVKKKDRTVAVTKLDVADLAKRWSLAFVGDVVRLRDSELVGMFHHSNASFIIGEITHSISYFVQAVDNLANEQDPLIEKLFGYAFSTPNYMTQGRYLADVVVHYPHWVKSEYHNRKGFRGYYFDRNYPSVGYKTVEYDTFTGSEPMEIPLQGRLKLAMVG